MTHAEAVLWEDVGAVIGFATVLFLPVVLCLVPVLLVGAAIRAARHRRQWPRICSCGAPLHHGLCRTCGAVIA